MSPLRSLLRAAAVVGVSGSRAPSPASVAALRAVLPLTTGTVAVGCARGIDQVARRLVPASRRLVFRAQSGRSGHLAVRSIACVRQVAAAASQPGGSLWLSFPSAACPAGLALSPSPSVCFRGLGSGTWASAALARGLGLPVLLCMPVGVACPAGWGFTALGSASGVAWHFAAGSVSGSLFA
ncbi:MAG: hypothetical protein AAF809_03925 [Bacteroidota bacterium]